MAVELNSSTTLHLPRQSSYEHLQSYPPVAERSSSFHDGAASRPVSYTPLSLPTKTIVYSPMRAGYPC